MNTEMNPEANHGENYGGSRRAGPLPFGRPRSGASSTGKLAFIALLIGLLLIPMGMIQGLIRERERNGDSAVREVTAKWGGSQRVTGPILTVPYRVVTRNEKGIADTCIQYAHFLPEELEVTGALEPEIRHRGIFDVALYRTDLHLTGRFAQPDFSGWRVEPENVLWNEAYLSLDVPDLRFLAGRVPLTWNGAISQCAPENYAGNPFETGLHSAIRLVPQGPGGKGYVFETSLALNGSGTLDFLPMGKETRVSLESPWSSPSFTGAYLPRANAVDKKGFRANWNVLSLTRPFPQSWRNREIGEQAWNGSAFGVDLMLPVDHYQKTTRCAKYAILFILLTFLVFFLVETFDGRGIHPLQYAVVGCALCLFYVLLVALTEHIPFAAAYAAAAAGMTGMISSYAGAVLRSRARALGLGGMLAGLYAYLFTLLRMEDLSLLMGALGLTAILGAVMYMTRRLNQNSQAAAVPAPEAA